MSVMDDLDARVDALYGGPPAEFTSARDALVAELRGAGLRAEADAVRALRRPSKLAAELNRLARQAPARTRALVAAQAGLAAAQARIVAGGGDAAELREAEEAEQAALDAFPGDGALHAALRVAARTERDRDDLLRGRLSRDPAPDAGGAALFALGPAVPPPAGAAATAPGADELAEARRARAAREAPRSEADDEARRAREERVRAAIAALEGARRAEGAATAARDAARRAADEADAAAARLAAERETLRRSLDEATAAAIAQGSVAREAAAALAAAEAALRTATRERDGAERAARRLADEGPG